MVEVTTLDLVIIGLYLLFMLLVGVWFVKRIKNTDDYYVAGRTLGPVVRAATVCATISGGSAMMGRDVYKRQALHGEPAPGAGAAAEDQQFS